MTRKIQIDSLQMGFKLLYALWLIESLRCVSKLIVLNIATAEPRHEGLFATVLILGLSACIVLAVQAVALGLPIFLLKRRKYWAKYLFGLGLIVFVLPAIQAGPNWFYNQIPIGEIGIFMGAMKNLHTKQARNWFHGKSEQ